MKINIKSKNPELLSILLKNKDTFQGLDLKPLRNGVIIGNCASDNEYEVIFQDSKYSFCDENHALDYQSYCNPQIILSIASELFRHILDKEKFEAKDLPWLGKTIGEVDKPHEIEINVPTIYIDSNWVRNGKFILSKYYDCISVEKVSFNLYSLTIKGELTVFYAFNLLLLSALFIAVTNEQFFRFDEQLAEKYIKVLENTKPCYFVVYLFKNRLLPYEERFKKMKHKLDKVIPNLQLAFGDTHTQRMQAIRDILLPNLKSILDIGCGEMRYGKLLLKHMSENHSYFAVDIDRGNVKFVEKLKENYKHDITFLDSIEDYRSKELVDVILTEVIEHMEVEEAISLVKTVIERVSFDNFILTTPNRDFNKFYELDHEFRHHDHKFEFNRSEFEAFKIQIEKMGVKTHEIQIGDSYEGISPSFAIVIKKA
jgi:hypothetical protein